VPDAILTEIEDRSARGIAAAISRMVRGGTLAPGQRLPTVRALSTQLGTSPTTVSEAWQQLAKAGVIEARGRNGTYVAGLPRPGGPRRFRKVTDVGHHAELDLSTGTPDPDLLPDLGKVLGRISRQNLTTSYLDRPVLPELDELLRERWPFTPEGLTVVDGALDALDRITTSRVRLGDRVLVENPCFPPVLDLLDVIGAEPIGLDLDDQGVQPESLERALAFDPVALYLQPRAHNPAGVSMSAARARRLAQIVKGRDLLVIEDDHAGDIASSADVSLGRWIPNQTVHIRSFSKSHGPDLRLAAIGGAGDVVEQVVNRRVLGSGWSSRLLQAVLVELLGDPSVIGQIAEARDTYAERRSLVTKVLTERGVGTTGTEGINLWVESHDEGATLVALAAQGIAVAPGTPFLVSHLGVDHVRVTVGLVTERHDELADRLATACLGSPAPWSRRR
jgi:DNA-binding transcriptional MocR family regulator